ncbi:unnamed protein product [Adineta steineri]|uniref:G-protein coupled receptors family 1 profile domain-containing protein n=1 Tax=Adineta steineri TaxID=433720 RepID=A0A815HV52_9BILA|nr:unnamed protein product [Adineta steineri]CAF1357443.1 unnamed protein product [Adineta steineri]
MGGIASSRLATIGISAMNRYGILFLGIIGIWGNLLNVYIFSRPHLRRNTCVLCLLISSFLNLIILIFGVFLRCLMGYNIDLTYNASIFCPMRYYLIYVCQSGSLWLIVLACVDRYLSSSLNMTYRQWMNRKRTNRIILFILIFSLLCYVEVFYCFEASFITNGYCKTKDKYCSYIDTASYLIFNSFLPSSLMLGFGAGMLINIKRSYQRIGQLPSYIGSINKINRRDKQLISMLLLQVALIGICMFPISIIKFYLSITISIEKANEQIYNEYFAYQLSVAISYINPSGMFFVHTLRGKLFRTELIRLFNRLKYHSHRNLLCRRISQIMWAHPINRF